METVRSKLNLQNLLQSTNFSPLDTNCVSGVLGKLVVQTDAPRDLGFSLPKSGSRDCCLCEIALFVVYHLHPRLQSWGASGWFWAVDKLWLACKICP